MTMTVTDFADRCRDQSNKCGACSNELNLFGGMGAMPDVDAKGRLRGVVCTSCGDKLAKIDPAMIAYLRGSVRDALNSVVERVEHFLAVKGPATAREIQRMPMQRLTIEDRDNILNTMVRDGRIRVQDGMFEVAK